jgi:hypothetical protein
MSWRKKASCVSHNLNFRRTCWLLWKVPNALYISGVWPNQSNFSKRNPFLSWYE